jgi:O-antigen/teichoic acid export membrane protein
MSEFLAALGTAAPYYNMAFALIALYMFLKLLKTNPTSKKVFLLPWKLILVALLIFMVEEIITVLRALGYISIPVHINGFFELVIISLFIYTLLIQKEHLG